MNELSAYFRTPRQSLREEAFMMRRLAFLLDSGMPLASAVGILESQGTGAAQDALRAVRESVEEGKSLADAFSAFPRFVRASSGEIIRVGEISGTLADNLRCLADDLRKKSALRSRLLGALLYPAIVSIAAIALAAGLVLFIFPKIIPLFAAFGADVPFTTRVVLGAYRYLSAWGAATAAGIILAAAAWIFAVRRYAAVRRKAEAAALRVPALGPLIRAYHISNLARTLALLLKSGMTLRAALPATARATRPLLYREELLRIAASVERGGGIAAYLRERRALFPELVAQMVSVGESSGALADAFASLSAFYEHEVDESIQGLSALVEPALMIIMGFVVGWIAVSIVSPMYAITQHLHAR